MNRTSLLRYNALAGYTRLPVHVVFIEELAWYAHDDERLLGAISLDRTDRDFGAVVVARDEKGRFRAVDFQTSFPTYLQAKDWLGRAFASGRASAMPRVRSKMDFFAPGVAPNRLHANFNLLLRDEKWSPARGIIEAMMPYYEDPDGNFVEQCQTSGFDARIWELYLFAALVELGFTLDRTRAVPDFSCRRGEHEVLIEFGSWQAHEWNVSPFGPKSARSDLGTFQRRSRPGLYAAQVTPGHLKPSPEPLGGTSNRLDSQAGVLEAWTGFSNVAATMTCDHDTQGKLNLLRALVLALKMLEGIRSRVVYRRRSRGESQFYVRYRGRGPPMVSYSAHRHESSRGTRGRSASPTLSGPVAGLGDESRDPLVVVAGTPLTTSQRRSIRPELLLEQNDAVRVGENFNIS